MRRTAPSRGCYPDAFFEGSLEGRLGLIAHRFGHRPVETDAFLNSWAANIIRMSVNSSLAERPNFS